jgi:CheY-like chemotaxis protein
VFEPFFTTKDVGKGTGLGLSQVYGFATQSGGEVLLQSEKGVGTTVTLVLPCSKHGRNTQGEKPPAATDISAISGCVLVVDDNEDVGAFAEALLRELGFDVSRAASGDEALRLFEKGKIDAVFTDVVMPGMSGVELARAIHEIDPAIPIVLTTGFSDKLSDQQVEFPVVFKPYRIEALEAAFRDALKK